MRSVLTEVTALSNSVLGGVCVSGEQGEHLSWERWQRTLARGRVSGARGPWNLIPVLPLSGCVIRGKWYRLSVLPYLHPYNGNNS